MEYRIGPEGKDTYLKDGGSGGTTEEGGTGAKPRLLHKKARHSPDPHMA